MGRPVGRSFAGERFRLKQFICNMLRLFIPLVLVLPAGCSLLPEVINQQVIHNPFPQLSKVAIAPFFNLSDEPKLDGRQFAMCYFNELQLIPGFEVVPISQVERAMQDHRISLASPQDARRLAQVLGVDALVVGAVTDYTPYYPPRCTLHVEWYTANPNFHPIPPGYGLPWGTPEEALISGSVVFDAEMTLAREQMKTQTPGYDPMPRQPRPLEQVPAAPEPEATPKQGRRENGVELISHTPAIDTTDQDNLIDPDATAGTVPWPDARGLIPVPPGPAPPRSWPSDAPAIRHTRAYNGHDPEFTQALAKYYTFRDDARFGGWQSYLERSEDFIRFCCHQHIEEMLASRGGAGETRVVWRWPAIR